MQSYKINNKIKRNDAAIKSRKLLNDQKANITVTVN